MRVIFAILIVLLIAGSSASADPIFIDQLVESPLETLREQFPRLRNEGCYRIGPQRHLLIVMDRKDQKPWRVVISTDPPCRRPEDGPLLDVQERSGIDLGVQAQDMLSTMGRPDAAAAPDAALRRLGDTEYFYICRVSEGCARHLSFFTRDGIVTAIAQWYSE